MGGTKQTKRKGNTMKMHRVLTAFMPVMLLLAPAVAENDEPADRPDDENLVPASDIRSLEALLEPPDEQLPRDELMELMKRRSRQLIERASELESEHPDAANLHEVRGLMLQSAAWLVMLGDDGAVEQARDVARRILDSDAPDDVKAHADFHLLQQSLLTPDTPPADAAERIQEFVSKYANTTGEVPALVRASVLANRIRRQALLDELLDDLEKHTDDPDARRVLRLAGRQPDVGRPFTAELTRLDGEKLTLPDDLLGKVVVVDFWATWCAPCVASIPHLKSVYERYRDRDVEFVGISLDHNRSELEEMVRERNLDWIHTYPGHRVAEYYGIMERGIPSIWVIGRDGKVVSDRARRDLEGTIERALAAEQPSRDQENED